MRYLIVLTLLVATLVSTKAAAAGRPGFRRPPEVVDANRRTLGTAAELFESTIKVVRRVPGGYVYLRVERAKLFPAEGFVYKNFESANCTGIAYLQSQDHYFVHYSWGRVDPITQQLIDPVLTIPDLTKTPVTRTFSSQLIYATSAECAADVPPGIPGPGGTCCRQPPPFTQLSIEATTLDLSEYAPPYSLR